MCVAFVISSSIFFVYNFLHFRLQTHTHSLSLAHLEYTKTYKTLCVDEPDNEQDIDK